MKLFPFCLLLLCSGLPILAAQTAVERLVAEGDYRFGDEDFHGAEKCYRQALALQPDWPEAFRGLGEVALANGELESAEKFFRKSLKNAKHPARSLAGLGYTKYERNEKDSAALFLGQALAMDSTNIDLEVFLARIHHELGNKGEAIRFAKTALKSDPERKEAILLLRDLGVAAEDALEPEGIETPQKAPELLK